MKLVTFARRGEDGDAHRTATGIGALTDDGIYDLTRAALYWAADLDLPISRGGPFDLTLLIAAGAERLESVSELLATERFAAAETTASNGSGNGIGLLNGDGSDPGVPIVIPQGQMALSATLWVPFDDVTLRAPVLRPGKIIGIGLNYLDHCREQGIFPPDQPMLFAMFANAVSDPGAPIVHPPWTSQLDFECELGVVIGSRAHRVSPEDALGHVFGYTIVNDVTARDAQKTDRQWLRAKGADGFAPIGPVIITPDEVSDPMQLRITSSVNGETWQDSSTSQMVFDVASLISYASHSITLEPGDIIATGSPAGVGHWQRPPRYLQPGDVVRCEIEGIGVLENMIVADDAVHVTPQRSAAADAHVTPVAVAEKETTAEPEAALDTAGAEDEVLDTGAVPVPEEEGTPGEATAETGQAPEETAART